MDYTGQCDPWGGDPCKDTPVPLDIVAAALKAAIERDGKDGAQ